MTGNHIILLNEVLSMPEHAPLFTQRDAAFTLDRIETFILRYPLREPVRTSFGVMHSRPALLVRVTDHHGATGWGEAWCNFPACGAEHRQRLIDDVYAPLLRHRAFEHPAMLFEQASRQTTVLAIQSGEPGPMSQALAAIDMAVWDMCARRSHQPLWRYLNGHRDRIPVYASGLNPTGSDALVEEKRQAGYQAFKLKVGFGHDQDLQTVSHIRSLIGEQSLLMLDANQAWTFDDALTMAEQLATWRPEWLEEPMRADTPLARWRQLAEHSPIPLAGGENLTGTEAFNNAMDCWLKIVQPDTAKWGGVSGVMQLIPDIQRRGLRYCPHYLGAGIGLLVSAHLLAASGGDGMLEIDANPNPLREWLCGPLARLQAGHAQLGDAPGIGITPDIEQLQRQLPH
ncbi:mandelate racemase/muconate lactonizing enzyme family protein [Jejubacter calystegiae]|nr:mandelate racemase/muconate lactonizing enzyme family protein [Jejubacter calystegiae]